MANLDRRMTSSCRPALVKQILVFLRNKTERFLSILAVVRSIDQLNLAGLDHVHLVEPSCMGNALLQFADLRLKLG